MKKLYCVLFFLVLLAFSCSKDDLLKPDQGSIQNLNTASFKLSGSVIQVFANGTDDTYALTVAFTQAKAIGKKAVVQLMPGTFKIGMIEVHEFVGTLKGSGTGSTTITNITGLSCDEVIQQNKVPALITFIGGDVVISDLTFKLTGEPFWGWDPNWGWDQEMNFLLFSDYSAAFTPATKLIKVNLKNLEMVGGLRDNDWDHGLPYRFLHGVKFAPDMWKPLSGSTLIPRSNINATISNSKFSKLHKGVYVWGCKSGNFNFGTEGGNFFSEDLEGLSVNETIGVNVKCENSEFNLPNIAPNWYYDGIDINSGEYHTFEYAPVGEMSVEIRHNTFNLFYQAAGIGTYDEWRFDYPADQSWIKMLCTQNTFNDMEDMAWPMFTFNMKDFVFSNNIIAGNGTNGYIRNEGLWWYYQDDNPLTWSDNCKFQNNIFMQKNFTLWMLYDTKNYQILGDLSNVTVLDEGVNNKVNGKTNQGHKSTNIATDVKGRMELIVNMINEQRDHNRH